MFCECFLLVILTEVLILNCSDGTLPVLGQPFQKVCTATKTPSAGRINSPQLQWTYFNGTPVVEGNGISFVTESVEGQLVLHFSSFHTSHAGSYKFLANLTSPALNSLVKFEFFNFTVTSKLFN